MAPERWRQIDQLFHTALELDQAEREAFLERACDADKDLRHEVTTLLVADAEADSVKQALLAEVAAEMLAADQTRRLIGKRIWRYEVLSQLGAGGMGEVYLAQDTRLGRKVALKLLKPSFRQDAEQLRRFEREACAASALNHPNILTIHEIGEIEDLHFIATEFVEGRTLRQLLKDGRPSLQETLEIAMQMASALNAAHSEGIIHLDIKPENVMARPDGLVKILDFGLAKLTERSAVVVGGQEPAATVKVIEPGMVMGTVAYMSPEQARGLEVDARSDIFSLGV
ncbi:MAG: serine/threonine protein kinase, partial [Chloracidobacterium sp.]|nr:serine/threonine protein kinase [Chloracidobacterium sp.]